MRMVGLLAGAALLGGCGAVGARPATKPMRAAPDFDVIAFEVSSWGRPLQSWRIAGGGDVEFRKAETLSHFQHFRVDTQRLTLGPEDVARIASLLAVARHHGATEIACTERVTDQPYGRITWQAAGTTHHLPFDTGCINASARAPLEAIRTADALVADRAANTPVVASEEVKPAG